MLCWSVKGLESQRSQIFSEVLGGVNLSDKGLMYNLINYLADSNRKSARRNDYGSVQNCDYGRASQGFDPVNRRLLMNMVRERRKHVTHQMEVEDWRSFDFIERRSSGGAARWKK